MASYTELVRRGVCRHSSCEDVSLWPHSVSQLVGSLQSELKLPGWLKSGPVPYTNERVLALLEHLRVSDNAARVDLWNHADQIVDNDVQQRLHVVFNGALADCARIRAVVDAEEHTQIPFPKESFVAVLVRNAILNSHPGLSSLEDVPVILPRHFSGETIPILNYMTKSFHVPLVISIFQEIPVEKNGSNLGRQPSGDDDTSDESESFNHSPPTMSEFLEACERPDTPEEVEEEKEEGVLPPQFDAYFLACPSSTIPPSICHVPVLCMADEERLPVLMSTLLYQRRVWHITDPLIGVEFSKYSTAIRLFVGWLEGDVSFGRALPRVHLGEMGTPIMLDLSSPTAALVVARLLGGLESHISGIRDTISHSVGAIISGTELHSSLSWRIDTDIQADQSVSILENDSNRDMIIKWAESQERAAHEETMPPRKQVDKISSLRSAMPAPPHHLTSTQVSSNPTSPSSVPSTEKSLSLPELREPDEYTDSVPTFCSRLSCSAFAATTEKDDHRVFRWMFNRRVVPQSLPSDLEFREEYSAMTSFIWPETWNVRDDLPPVDAALEPCIQELLEDVASIKTRPNAIKCIPVKEFPIDLQLLGQSFSAVFQASRRSREKKELPGNVYEASWRHDHDRLLFDFFIRSIKQRENCPAHALDSQSIVHLEDPFARPTLETTLRLPKSDNVQRDSRQQLEKSIQKLVFRGTENLDNWLESRGDTLAISVEEVENAAYVISQLAAWRRGASAETEAQMISKLGQLPLRGRCDALGRLLVELPDVSSDDVDHLALVVHAAGKNSAGAGRVKDKAFTGESAARAYSRGKSEPTTRTSSRSLTVPDVSSGPATTTNGTRYTILSSSRPSSMQSFDKGQTSSEESMDTLASKAQRLRLGPGGTMLELPILAVEYKKASDSTMKGTNQVRMYLTASVKFLHAIGITNTPVYGVQTDGPIVTVPAAIVRDDNLVYLFERLVERLDISTPLGAWHYATILCRLAQNHAKVLERRFEEVKENLVASLLKGGDWVNEWTADHQRAKLKAESRAKSPVREKVKKRSEVV